jgi:predicted TPR repeat methyltransferase
MNTNPQDITALLAANRPKEALLAASTLCDQAPDRAEHWYLLAGIHAGLGNTAEAITCCRKVLSMSPDHAGANLNLAQALAQQGDYESARDALERLVAIDPGNAQIHNSVGNLHYVFGHASEAEVAYRRAIALKPSFVEAYSNLGKVQLAQNNHEEAQESLRRALMLDPRHAASHLGIGKALQQAGQDAVALPCFYEALRLQPDLLEAQLALILALRGMGQDTEADQRCQMMAAQQPQRWQFWMQQGHMLNKVRRPSDAGICFEIAALIKPDDAETHFHLGRTLIKLEKREAAIAEFKAALDRNPGHDGARHYLAALGIGKVPERMAPDQVISLFDQYATHFDRHLVRDLEYAVPDALLRLVTPHLGECAPKPRVLDLGCGTGLCGVSFRSVAGTLTGADLSAAMIEKARERRIYDRLLVADVMQPLTEPGAAYDIIISGDVFVYIGELTAIFRASSRALSPTGLFAFSIEEHVGDEPYVLNTTGRYTHSLDYLQALGTAHRLQLISHERCTIRKNSGIPVMGVLCLFKTDTRTL